MFIMREKEVIIDRIATNIRIGRYKNSMTQEMLAEKVGVSTKYINLIENRRVNPSFVIIVKICDSLKIDLNSIVQEY